MNISLTAADNITEVLAKILEFTERRRALITHNITNVNTPGYEPRDLDVTEFADLMTQAISEHIHSQRLLLRDGRHIHFGQKGSFETTSIADERARRLLVANSKEYLCYQTEKLSETLLNSLVAGDLLDRQEILDATPRYF
jgi:flagellar basal-body rod protein FlgB